MKNEYQCTNCDDLFVHEGGGKLRCPKCLRTNGLLPADEASSSATVKRPGKRAVLWGALGVCLIGLAAGGGMLLYKRSTDLPAPGQLATLDRDTLRLTLLSRGVPAELAEAAPFRRGEKVAALAGAVKEDDPGKRARAVAGAVGKALGPMAPLLTSPPTWTPREPEALLEAAAGEPGKVASLEAAALLVAALRAADLSAVLAERHESAAPVGVADSSGFMGRYVAVAYRPGELGKEPLVALDPLAGLKLPAWAVEPGKTGMETGVSGLTLLGDGSAAGHLLSLRALASGAKETSAAYALSRAALAAATPSATLQLARAQVLAAAGGLKDGLTEARKALALRDDAPRQAGLARLLLSSGDMTRALTHLRQAVKAKPGYWPARLLLATVLSSMDPEKGEEQLQEGLKVAPEEPGLLLLDGMSHLARDMPGQAAVRLRKASAALGNNMNVLLMLYHALKQSSAEEEAAALRKKILSLAKDREEMGKRLDMIDRAPEDEGPGGEGEAGNQAVPRLELPDVSLTP